MEANGKRNLSKVPQVCQDHLEYDLRSILWTRFATLASVQNHYGWSLFFLMQVWLRSVKEDVQLAMVATLG
jgi:hypothetical protein